MSDRLPIVHPRIDEYLLGLVPERDPVLREMEDLAASRGFPIVGPQVGSLLHLLSRSLGARRVLELGSGFGYSSAWFARALGPGGRVVATESSPVNAELGAAFLARAGLADRVEYRVGHALEIARDLEGPFDVVFNDIDKQDYPRVLEAADRLLRVGGLLISDNMLWHGSVLEGLDEKTRGVRELTRLLFSADRYVTTLVPLRDGVSISLKLG